MLIKCIVTTVDPKFKRILEQSEMVWNDETKDVRDKI